MGIVSSLFTTFDTASIRSPALGSDSFLYAHIKSSHCSFMISDKCFKLKMFPCFCKLQRFNDVTLLDNGVRSSEAIMTDLQERSQTWIVYDNPDTTEEESERIWLVLRFGYVFGSVYAE